jgi:predicted amidohydrolase
MMICNDRRWPEAWRVLGLQQVELVMLGYNTPSLNMENRGFEAHHLRVFHSHLSIQAGCYQNACFAVGVAKAGTEDGHELFGHSIIVNPQGEIMAQATSWDDELIVADATSACASSAGPRSSTSPAPPAGSLHAHHHPGGQRAAAGLPAVRGASSPDSSALPGRSRA